MNDWLLIETFNLPIDELNKCAIGIVFIQRESSSLKKIFTLRNTNWYTGKFYFTRNNFKLNWIKGKWFKKEKKMLLKLFHGHKWIRLFRIISIPSKFCYFRPPDHLNSMECTALDFRCQCTQQKLQSICAVLTFDPQLKNILTFSVKDRYQLNYFICIKDFNAETITSLKLNLFSFFICGCQHQRKAICLYVYISDIRQIVGYRTPIFIQPFPWRLHITITYNLRIYDYDMLTLSQ